eukprot:187732_1
MASASEGFHYRNPDWVFPMLTIATIEISICLCCLVYGLYFYHYQKKTTGAVNTLENSSMTSIQSSHTPKRTNTRKTHSSRSYTRTDSSKIKDALNKIQTELNMIKEELIEGELPHPIDYNNTNDMTTTFDKELTVEITHDLHQEINDTIRIEMTDLNHASKQQQLMIINDETSFRSSEQNQLYLYDGANHSIYTELSKLYNVTDVHKIYPIASIYEDDDSFRACDIKSQITNSICDGETPKGIKTRQFSFTQTQLSQSLLPVSRVYQLRKKK